MSASLASFPRQSAAAELITLMPGPAIQKFTVSFSIAKPALQPPTSTPSAFASVILLADRHEQRHHLRLQLGGARGANRAAPGPSVSRST
jgi:hypothetical protein